MSADLHIHTFFSDGTQSPEEIVELAQKAELKTIAITDHDVVAGLSRALHKGNELGVEVIPGIEFTTEARDTEIHILGYFIDLTNAELIEAITLMQQDREKRIFKICDKLKGLGVVIDPGKVFEIAGHRAAGRPHVARALVKEGLVSDFKEAFNRYIDFHGPAYVSHYKLSPEEAIRLVVKAGGIPVYAHPAVSNCDDIIPELMVAGLRGLEAYYPSHSHTTTQRYLNLANKYGLLITGGSDFHGFTSGREVKVGDVSINDKLVNKLRDEHLR